MKKDLKVLDRAFNPRCVVVAGDKQQTDYMWLRNVSTFQGKVYSVQIDEKELPGIKALGVENYTSLLDIPEPVDYVICAVPRAAAPIIIRDCIQRGVAGVTLFTSGFAETDTEEGTGLQKVIYEMAEEANLHLIGPNCMGIFNPKIGLRHNMNQYHGVGGEVGFISQSGTHAIVFSLEAHLNGIDISKSVSYGNGIVLESVDYLEYLGQDQETKIIGMYIEGVREGRRFFQRLREVARRKPVLVWKGGQTEEGSRATHSHTGSLAVPNDIWDAAIKQCGAIKIDNLEEMVDTIKALLYLRPALGPRVALVGGSGGWSVSITDAFAKMGLEVPLLTEESYEKFASFFNLVGASCRNPIDPGSNRVRMADILNILNEDANVDALVMITGSRLFRRNPQVLSDELDLLFNLRERSHKPLMAVIPALSSSEDMGETQEIAGKFLEGSIPTFPTFERGAGALKRLVDYYEFQRSLA